MEAICNEENICDCSPGFNFTTTTCVQPTDYPTKRPTESPTSGNLYF